MFQKPSLTVLVTDYAWKDLDIERQILSEVGAKLIEAKTGNEEEVLKLVPGADGILTW
ncbi:hypothetical protein MYX78_01935 [Acidobacteria bacterium AH-259-G07]|nr:hypothetical protein [Acidobacteria bacterium AH-259-G07]